MTPKGPQHQGNIAWPPHAEKTFCGFNVRGGSPESRPRNQRLSGLPNAPPSASWGLGFYYLSPPRKCLARSWVARCNYSENFHQASIAKCFPGMLTRQPGEPQKEHGFSCPVYLFSYFRPEFPNSSSERRLQMSPRRRLVVRNTTAPMPRRGLHEKMLSLKMLPDPIEHRTHLVCPQAGAYTFGPREQIESQEESTLFQLVFDESHIDGRPYF